MLHNGKKQETSHPNSSSFLFKELQYHSFWIVAQLGFHYPTCICVCFLYFSTKKHQTNSYLIHSVWLSFFYILISIEVSTLNGFEFPIHANLHSVFCSFIQFKNAFIKSIFVLVLWSFLFLFSYFVIIFQFTFFR